MSEKNKRVVRRYFEELDRRRATPVDLCAAGFAFHVAGFPTMDLEATTRFAAIFFSGLPDLSHPLDELIAEGDKWPFAAGTRARTPQTSWESQRAGNTSR
jgi:predicted ester cyclase